MRYFFLVSMILLMLLPAHAQDDGCGELPSQLVVGQTGRVTPGDANNMRDTPSTSGNRVGQVPGEAEFTVLDGPVCSDGYTWWQINYDGLVGWTVESIADSYSLEPLVPPTPTPIPTPTLIPTAAPLPETRQTADFAIWSVDGSTLAVSSQEGIWLYDTTDWLSPPRLFSSENWYWLGRSEHLYMLNLRYKRDTRMALNFDGSRLAMAVCVSASESCRWTIEVIDTETGERIQRYNGLAGSIRGIAFLNDDRIVFGNADAVIRIWEISSNRVLDVYEDGGVERVIQANPSGTQFGGVSERGVRIFDLEADESYQPRYNWDESIIFSPDLQFIVWDTLYQNRGNVGIRENADGGLSYQLPVVDLDGDAKIAQVYSFTGDNSRLVIGYRGGAIRMWDVVEQEEIYWLPNAHDNPVISIEFRFDGAYFASVTYNNKLVIWDAKTGEPIVEL